MTLADKEPWKVVVDSVVKKIERPILDDDVPF
jgi:hypothetical protein